jgi:hypothetical protein
MWKKLVATVLALSLPAGASAGPLKEAADRAARELASAQRDDTRSRGRFWTGIALIGGGVALASLGGGELGGEDEGPNDPPEPNDGGELGGKAMLAGGIAAAALGGVLLLTWRTASGPVVAVRPGGVAVRHAIRF